MKNYTITVNGNVYDVTVEEKTTGENRAAAPAAPSLAPSAPKAKPAAPSPLAPAKAAAGSVKIEAGAAGKVFKVEAKVGQHVKKGEAVIILEAMKMEIPVVAPVDGTVASITVAAGDAVAAGQLLAALN